MCILVTVVEFQGCGCVGRRAMDQCPDAAATGSEFAICAMGEREEVIGVDCHPGRYCRLCAVVWLRDYLQSIRYWHAYLLFWGVSYPDLALVDHFDRLDETVRICRAEAFAWATSQIFA